MGIKFLKWYISLNSDVLLSEIDLRNRIIVIDGMNLMREQMRKLKNEFGRYGTTYEKFAERITCIFDKMVRVCLIKPIVVLDSLHDNTMEDCIATYISKISNKNRANKSSAPSLFKMIFRDILKKMGITLIQPIGKDINTIAVISKVYNCPVLSCDNDYYLYGVTYLINSQFGHPPGSNKQLLCLRGQLFEPEKFQHHYNLEESLLPLAMALLGKHNKLLDCELMDLFNEYLNENFQSNAIELAHQRFDRLFMWLSQYENMYQAITDLAVFYGTEDRKTILYLIEKYIRHHARPSRLVLEFLGANNDTISELETEHDEMISGLETLWTDLTVNQNQEDEDENLPRYTEQYTEEQLLATLPDWLIEDYIQGNVSGTCIEMLMYRAVFLTVDCVDMYHAEQSEITFPILSAMFSLMTSMSARPTIMEVYANRGPDLIRKKIRVPQSDIQLEQVRDLQERERRAILNRSLGLRLDENFDEIPDDWKLYIATVIFWMRSTSPLEKNNMHLRAILVTIVCSLVNDKIDNEGRRRWRRKSEFNDYFSTTERSQPTAQINLHEAINSIRYEDCILARKFFDLNLTIDMAEDVAFIMKPFQQLDQCLKRAMQFNNLLGRPYANVPVEKLFNQVMFRNLYCRFKNEHSSHYIIDYFKNAISVLNVFLSLERVVRIALER